jgi:hypothetical protein
MEHQSDRSDVTMARICWPHWHLILTRPTVVVEPDEALQSPRKNA